MTSPLPVLAMTLALAAPAAIAGPVLWDSGTGGNDHYYELVTTPAAWSDARLDAAARSYNGLQGYLASVTSLAENNFILNLIAGQPAVWIGGTDLGSDGTWYWVDGPEDGQIFYQNGSPVAFSGFPGGEPNGGTSENALETGFFGIYWNDRPETQPWAYIVEYGGVAAATTPVPAPAGATLLIAGLLGLGWASRRKSE